jgi:rhodanese-related sulfurtransferase
MLSVIVTLAVVVIVSITCFNFFCVGQQLLYKTISVSDARAMMQAPSNVLVVDVRTPEEYGQGHLKDAINIPLYDLPLRIGGFEQNRPILVYCQTGYRSAQASSILVKAGFTKVYNLEGGIIAWINSGYPTVTS